MSVYTIVSSVLFLSFLNLIAEFCDTSSLSVNIYLINYFIQLKSMRPTQSLIFGGIKEQRPLDKDIVAQELRVDSHSHWGKSKLYIQKIEQLLL